MGRNGGGRVSHWVKKVFNLRGPFELTMLSCSHQHPADHCYTKYGQLALVQVWVSGWPFAIRGGAQWEKTTL